MRRLAIFLIVGPTLGTFAILLTSAMLGNKPSFTDPDEWAMGLFACFLLSAPSGLFDKLMAYFARPALRVPLTATCGAMAVAALLALRGTPPSNLPTAMLVVAVCMGICSWLSSERGGAPKERDAARAA
jgi:hypothetical protein